jgi:hypothetical protein
MGISLIAGGAMDRWLGRGFIAFGVIAFGVVK